MSKISEKRKMYVGFGSLLLLIIAFLVILSADWYWTVGLLSMIIAIGIYDKKQKKHTLLRNFPVLGHIRYILEFFRPEIQQYFIASDTSEKPFNRHVRDMIYQRSKGEDDTISFGTAKDIMEVGYEWGSHSLAPKHLNDVCDRVTIGNFQCKKPYSSSRLNISAMSYGAISKNGISALNKGAKKGGFYHNTGEGGLSDYHLHGGDIALQIGTAYFGFRTEEGSFDSEKFKEKALLESVKIIEIKLSQGAKPAHGGLLPKEKISDEIARIRGVGKDKDVESPPCHTAFSSPRELCFFIQKLRELSAGKPIGFKLCLGKRTEFIAICKAMMETNIYPDFITIDGMEGGTGAAPAEFANSLGVPLKESIIFIYNCLVGFGIKKHIKIIAAGKSATSFDMIRNIALGADIINSARAMMMALGCIQSKQCSKNTCPVGVATQDPGLYKNLDVDTKAERVFKYHEATVKSFMEMVGAMGIDNPDDIRPSSIYRKVDKDTSSTLDEIYDFYQPDCLLKDDTVPVKIRKFWDAANPDSFSFIK